MSKKISSANSYEPSIIKKSIVMLKELSLWLKESGKQHKHLFLIGIIIFLFLLVSAFSPLAFKALADYAVQKQQTIIARNDMIQSAILNNDYDTWYGLTVDKNLREKITKENFSQFSEAYNLLQAGKVEEADILKRQLSLKDDLTKASIKSGQIDQAIQNNDYNAWREIVGKDKDTTITADNFNRYGEIYRLISSGNIVKANALKIKLGLKEKRVYTSSH